MEQYKNALCAPASPMRHIHSSFPHYFYSTPAAPPPSSHSISAFVALCESRLLAEDNVDTPATPASSSTVAPKPTVPAPQPARPLKPPPRLQYIASIRKSLRNGIPALRRASRGGGGGGSRAPAKLNSNVARKDGGADPFAAAAHKVSREEEEEEAPRWQLPWRRNRKSKPACKAKLADDRDAKATAVSSRSGHGMMSQAEVATSKNRKGSWILRMLRSAIKAKGKEKESSIDSKEEEEEEEDHGGKNGQLVGLVRSTTASRRRRVLVRRRTRGSSRRIQY